MLGEFFSVRRRRRRNVKTSYCTRGDLACPFMMVVRLDGQRLAQVRTHGLKFLGSLHSLLLHGRNLMRSFHFSDFATTQMLEPTVFYSGDYEWSNELWNEITTSLSLSQPSNRCVFGSNQHKSSRPGLTVHRVSWYRARKQKTNDERCAWVVCWSQKSPTGETS
jgi:hypothetical protein